jgi:hypothetical protein
MVGRSFAVTFDWRGLHAAPDASHCMQQRWRRTMRAGAEAQMFTHAGAMAQDYHIDHTEDARL